MTTPAPLYLHIVVYYIGFLWQITPPLGGLLGNHDIDPQKVTNKRNYSPSILQEPPSATKSVFDHILPVLKEKTRVPLRLPTYLATENEQSTIYAIIETATQSDYKIQLAFDGNCKGGNSCRYGSVSGKAVRTKVRMKGTPIRLKRGITGYFIDATCGAVCSDSTMTWKQNDYIYTVGIKGESIKALTKVANSAIDADGRAAIRR